MNTTGTTPPKPLQAKECSQCLDTGICVSSDWETYWIDRDRLYLAGYADAEIDNELTPPDGPETTICLHRDTTAPLQPTPRTSR